MKTVKAIEGTTNELKDHYFYLSNNFLMACPILCDEEPDSFNDSIVEEWVALDELSQESLVEILEIYRKLFSLDFPCDELTKVYVQGLRTKKIEVYA
tara:strand:+ start:3594 stop:3884 length:291 start_codon:yes stop_codon:yes gene_type:complete